MAPLQKELSTLEVELLEIVGNAPESEQDSSLDTLTALSDVEVAALLISKSVLPVAAQCCCCCTFCACCE